ncbi:hypothetical protein CEXT_140631 [Caerostris extrusa]|uniref:Uncharacterized protein n=1 Tax=Caerostris extrusa TaxID=172846 RepID=A0AAV4VDE8_CAEEX|nr:hypothetical protein CEXT_140631 [Caerostris extrusa]
MLWPTDEKEDAVRIVLLIASDEFSSKILITVFVILPDAERESKLRQNFARFLDCFIVGFLIYLISCDMYLASRDMKDAPFDS